MLYQIVTHQVKIVSNVIINFYLDKQYMKKAIANTFAIVASSVAALFVAANFAAAATYDMGSTTLLQGSTGMYVSNMQSALNACAGASLSTDGKFGPMTKAGVMAFQSSHSLTADGKVGPMTKAAINAACGSSTPSTGGSTTLSGGAGSVSEYKLLTSPTNNREVGEDDADVKVMGISVEADDSSDLNVTAMKVVLGSVPSSPASDNFEDYADELTIWYGSTQVASADASDFNDDNNYSKTLSFNKDAVIKAGEVGKFYIAISGVNNLDSDDIGEDWTVDVTSVRWVDAQNAVISDDTSSDFTARTFSFESFATANDVELKFMSSTDTPDAQTVEADDNGTTDNVVLLKGKIKAIGGDIEIKELPISVDAAGTGDISEIASAFTLKIDGDEIQSLESDECDSPSCTASETYTFDDVDFTVDSGDTVEFEILADINEVDDIVVGEGDSLTASVSGTDVDNIQAEDETGEDLGTSEKTGSSIGEAQSFRTEGISLTFISATESVTAGTSTTDDTGTFKIKFKVSAFGDTVYVPNVASDAGTNAVNFDVDATGYNAVTGVIVDDSDSNLSSGGNFDIEDGDSENFTLTVSVDNNGGTADLYRAVLSNVRWNTTDSASTFTDYTFNLDDFKTDYISLN